MAAFGVHFMFYVIQVKKEKDMYLLFLTFTFL